jgi:hypothetical protein
MEAFFAAQFPQSTLGFQGEVSMGSGTPLASPQDPTQETLAVTRYVRAT